MFKTSGILKGYTCSVLCMFWLSYPVPMLQHADCVHNRCLCCVYSRFSFICNVLFNFFCKTFWLIVFSQPFQPRLTILKQIKKLLFCYCTKAWRFFSDGKAICLRNKYNNKLPSSSFKNARYHKTQKHIVGQTNVFDEKRKQTCLIYKP